jgi:hypothetical protein
VTRIEAEIAAKDMWIEHAFLEKDNHMLRLAQPGLLQVERDVIAARLEYLDGEIERVRSTKRLLERIQFLPECSFPSRPQLKATLDSVSVRKRA